MSSNNGNRKRNQKSKGGAHQRNTKSENHNVKMRDSNSSQHQWQQQNENPQKSVADNRSHQNQYHQQQKQQQKQQHQIRTKQQQSHSTTTFSKSTNQQTTDTETSTQDVMPKTVAVTECCNKMKSNTNKSIQESNSSLHSAILWRRHDQVEALLKSGSTPWESDLQGNTAFMVACKTSDLRLISTLWDTPGVKPDVQHANKDGDTALHLCALSGHEDSCRFLMSRDAGLIVKNKSGDTPLHLAAKGDHVSICTLLLSSTMSSRCNSLDARRLVLEENVTGQTAICLSIFHQHAQITRMFLDLLTAQQQATYLTTRLQKVLTESQQIYFSNTGSSVPSTKEVFLHGLLVSLSVLLICLSEKSRQSNTLPDQTSDSRLDHCLVNTDIIQTIIRIALKDYVNKQIVPIACFLLIYLMEGFSEKNTCNVCDKVASAIDNNKSADEKSKTGSTFLEKFIKCGGPNNLLLKMNDTEVADPSNAVITIALALTVVSLVRSVDGRSWLESNRRHLTFLKEIVRQNRSILSLLTTTCPLLTISYLESVCRDFVRLVELLEDKDREHNLAELLWEEERDRKRRERKKQKQQNKKQHNGKEAKRDSVLLSIQMTELSSEEEEENRDSLTDKTLAERGQQEMYSVSNRAMEIDHGNGNSDKTNLSKDCYVEDIDSKQAVVISNECIDDASNSMTQQESIVKPNEFLSLFHDDATPKQMKLTKTTSFYSESDGDVENQEKTVDVKPKDKKGGELSASNVMRWADVAKIGCSNTSDKCPSDLHDLARISCNKMNLCDWSLSSSVKNDFSESSGNVLFTVSKSEALDHRNALGNAYYDVIKLCPIASTNSDEETSSCSSSSVESYSSLASDSFLHKRSMSWMSEKVNFDVDVGNHMIPVNTTDDPGALSSSTRSRRKRRKSKQKQSKTNCEDNTISRCWGPSLSQITDDSIVYMSPTDVKFEESSMKSSIKLPLVRETFLQTGSENLPNPHWLSVDKSRGANPNSGERNIDPPNALIVPNSKRRDQTSSTQRFDTPTALPPLKIREVHSHRTGACHCCFQSAATPEIKTEEQREDEIKREKGEMNNRQSFCSKNTLLSGIKTVVSSCNTTNVVNDETLCNGSTHAASSSENNILPKTNIFTLTSPSTSQALFPTFSMAGQHNPSTLPPPGFNAFSQKGSAQAVADILHLDKSLQTNKRQNDTGPRIASPGKKGRVFTTVLLDKVKNPPLSFQQPKIPLLSTLAWNCGQESKLSWSTLLQSHPTSSVTASVFDKNTTRVQVNKSGNTPFSHDHFEPPAIPQYTKTLENGEMKPLARCLPLSESSLHTDPTFSTVLINRIQQRSSNRDSFSNPDSKDEPSSSKSSHNIFAVTGFPTSEQPFFPNKRNLETASTISVQSADILNNYDNAYQRFDRGHASTTHRRTYNQYNPQEQQMTSMGVTVETRAPGDVSEERRVERLANNKLRDDCKEEKCKLLNSQSLTNQRQLACFSDSRNSSPPVFFPDQIRDQLGTPTGNWTNFPSFHDVHTSDFLSEMFSDPLFTDNVAINQIRQKILSSQSIQSIQSGLFSQTPEECDVDLDYYASLYQMKFRDVLGSLPGPNRLQQKPGRQDTLMGGQGMVRHNASKNVRDWPHNYTSFLGLTSLSGNQVDILQSKRHSLRWHRSLQKILDHPWTKRRQYGNIVMPHPIPQYSIGMAGNVLIVLGFLMDGTEVAVLVVDNAHAQIASRIVDIMCNQDVEKHFLTRCRSFSESSDVQYLAMDLYEYSLCEYLQLCLPAYSQSIDVYTGLVWQLLQALFYLHHKLGMPHGYLAPSWVFINTEGHLRLAGFGMTTSSGDGISYNKYYNNTGLHGFEHRTSCWMPGEELSNDRTKSSFSIDIHDAGKLAYFILTKGQHLFGVTTVENDVMNLIRDRVSSEAFDLISPMLTLDPQSQPTVDQCLKHPIFWSGDKKFRLILIVGSDVLTEMKTGIALTGTGAPTMMEILSLIDVNRVSPNWIHDVDSTVLKEMRSFRVYKNNLAELTLFVYNCCLHFDKLSSGAKEVLDDPCKYFQNLFPGLFMAIYRSLKSSDRTERTCYKPFF